MLQFNSKWLGGWGWWLESDNKTISVQSNLTRTATGLELGKTKKSILTTQKM